MSRTRLKVWVSYSHVDAASRKALMQAIEEHPDAPRVDWRSDDTFGAGHQWPPEAEREIQEADAWILLLSPAFLNSTPCCDVEYPRIRMKMDEPGNRVIPVMIRQCEFRTRLPAFELTNVVGYDSPLDDGDTPSEVSARREDAVERITRELRTIGIQIGITEPERLAELEAEMHRGAFTPFLGPACLDLRMDAGSAREHLRARTQCLLDKLVDDSGARTFVESVVESQGLTLEGEALESTSEEPPSEAFLGMQVAIAQAGAAVCEVFGEALSGHRGLTDPGSYSVPIETGSSLKGLLDDAIRHARVVAEDPLTCPARSTSRGGVARGANRRPAICLGGDGISTKLHTLRETAFGERSEATQSMGAEGRRLEAVRESRPWRMELRHLAWLGDLLWHTLRFEAPLFPSPRDLSFQLSLCAHSPGCVEMMPLATAAAVCRIRVTPGEDQRREVHEDCPTHIVRPVSSQAGGVNLSLSRGLARLLTMPTDDAPVMPEPGAEQSSAHAAYGRFGVGERTALQPLLLSTNLDRDVEILLEEGKHTFYELFPVTLSPQGQPDTPGWMLVEHEGGSVTDSWYVHPATRFREVVRAVRGKEGRRLTGPIVVRLRGAPFAPLPGARNVSEILPGSGATSVLGSYTQVDHRILLSCLEYAREFTAYQRLPQCVRDLMGEKKRVLCLLGHVLDEPDSLFGLRPEAWRTPGGDVDRGPDASTETWRSIDSEPVDDLRAALLERLGIRPLRDRLEDVGRALCEILECREETADDR